MVVDVLVLDLKGQNQYLFWYLMSFSSVIAVFQHFLPKFLVGSLCNTRSQADNSRQNLKLHSENFSRTERNSTFFMGLRLSEPKRGEGGLTIRPDYMIRANSVVYRHQPKAAHLMYPYTQQGKYTARPKSV